MTTFIKWLMSYVIGCVTETLIKALRLQIFTTITLKCEAVSLTIYMYKPFSYNVDIFKFKRFSKSISSL